MSLISPIPFPGSPVILEEFDADYFEVVGSQLRTKSPAVTTNLATFDALTNKLTTTVNGVIATVDMGSLDDEGVTMTFSAGNLVMSNKAGTVLSTTPIPDLDAQQLTIAGNVISLTNGGAVTLPSAPATTNTFAVVGTDLVSTINGVAATVPLASLDKQQLTIVGDVISLTNGGSVTLPAAPPITVSNTVTGTGLTRTISTTVSGVTGTPVAIPDTDAQTLSIAGNVISLTNGGSVTLPVVPPTTNTLTLVSGVLTSTVDGVAANVTIPPVDCAAIKAAYPATTSAPSASTTLLTNECTTVKLVRATSAFGTLLNYYNIPV